MTGAVVDASVAIKWVVPEDGTARALGLRRHRLAAPDLLVTECANVLWKKVRRGELSNDEAMFAARLLARTDLELVATRPMLPATLGWACILDHPAYDCAYLALAEARGQVLITADARLQRKLKDLTATATAMRVRVVHLGDIDPTGAIPA